MTGEIKRKLSPEQTSLKRAEVVAAMSPKIAHIFEKLPQINAAVMYVAQYWADEANDAVHVEMSYSLRDAPDIEAHLARQSSVEENEDFLMMEGEETAAAIGYVNPYADVMQEVHRPTRPGIFDWLLKPKPAAPSPPPPPTTTVSEEMRNRAYELEDLLRGPFWDTGILDDNGASITLFAAFTKEGAHQEMPYGEAYLPYAVFHRAPGGVVRTEVVGKMVRPWLDGVAPEYDLDAE